MNIQWNTSKPSINTFFESRVFTASNHRWKFVLVNTSSRIYFSLEYLGSSYFDLFASVKVTLNNKKYEFITQFSQAQTDYGFFVPSFDEYNITASVEVSTLSYNSKETTGFVGMRNLGATCYINSLIQMLFNIKKFRADIFNIGSNFAASKNSWKHGDSAALLAKGYKHGKDSLEYVNLENEMNSESEKSLVNEFEMEKNDTGHKYESSVVSSIDGINESPSFSLTSLYETSSHTGRASSSSVNRSEIVSDQTEKIEGSFTATTHKLSMTSENATCNTTEHGKIGLGNNKYNLELCNNNLSCESSASFHACKEHEHRAQSDSSFGIQANKSPVRKPHSQKVLLLQKLFKDLQLSDTAVDTTEFVVSNVWEDNIHMHQDIHEFSKLFFDMLEKETGKKDFIEDLIQGEVTNYIKGECGCVSNIKEKFQDIQVVIRDFFNKKLSSTLEDSLELYTKPEVLDGDNKYCCDQHGLVNAEKGVSFSDLPPVLFVLLKRFNMDYETGEGYKINDYFEFPSVIDMKKYVYQERDHSGDKDCFERDFEGHANSDLDSIQNGNAKVMEHSKNSDDKDLLTRSVCDDNINITPSNERNPDEMAAFDTVGCDSRIMSDVNDANSHKSEELKSSEKSGHKTDESPCNKRSCDSGLINKKRKNNDFNYKLYSVIVHKGDHNEGHFYVYLNINEKWFKFNDTIVTQVSRQEAMESTFGGNHIYKNKVNDHSAYYLVYIKDSMYSDLLNYPVEIPRDTLDLINYTPKELSVRCLTNEDVRGYCGPGFCNLDSYDYPLSRFKVFEIKEDADFKLLKNKVFEFYSTRKNLHFFEITSGLNNLEADKVLSKNAMKKTCSMNDVNKYGMSGNSTIDVNGSGTEQHINSQNVVDTSEGKQNSDVNSKKEDNKCASNSKGKLVSGEIESSNCERFNVFDTVSVANSVHSVPRSKLSNSYVKLEPLDRGNVSGSQHDYFVYRAYQNVDFSKKTLIFIKSYVEEPWCTDIFPTALRLCSVEALSGTLEENSKLFLDKTGIEDFCLFSENNLNSPLCLNQNISAFMHGECIIVIKKSTIGSFYDYMFELRDRRCVNFIFKEHNITGFFLRRLSFNDLEEKLQKFVGSREIKLISDSEDESGFYTARDNFSDDKDRALDIEHKRLSKKKENPCSNERTVESSVYDCSISDACNREVNVLNKNIENCPGIQNATSSASFGTNFYLQANPATLSSTNTIQCHVELGNKLVYVGSSTKEIDYNSICHVHIFVTKEDSTVQDLFKKLFISQFMCLSQLAQLNYLRLVDTVKNSLCLRSFGLNERFSSNGMLIVQQFVGKYIKAAYYTGMYKIQGFPFYIFTECSSVGEFRKTFRLGNRLMMFDGRGYHELQADDLLCSFKDDCFMLIERH